MSGYAVSWSSLDGVRYAGRLDLGQEAATLSGGISGSRRRETVPFDDIDQVDIRRGQLHISRYVGSALLIASLDGPGVLREVADQIATLIAR